MRDDHMRRPGEAAFALVLLGVSLFLLWSAYGISGFSGLSEPGALPMASAFVMAATAAAVAVKTWRARLAPDETIARDIAPPRILLAIAMVGGYALLLKPLGFLPTSFLFVAAMVRALSGRSILFCAGVSAASVLLIYAVFRLIFTVTLPEGIVPEREILAWMGRLMGGGR